MFKSVAVFCIVITGFSVLCADSYSDLMYKAEKLTEKRYNEKSRAYRIKSAELDSILNSKETTSQKIARLKIFIREMEDKKTEPNPAVIPGGTVKIENDGKSEYQQAMKYMNTDPDKAEALLKQSLVYGNYKAASALGKIYAMQISSGDAYRKHAEEYYEIALKHGDLSVQLPLAELYAQHYEYLPKQKQANTILWLEQAAESDNISAMLCLAEIYRNSDQKKMLKYLRRAAKLKEPEALYRLGMYYLSDGHGKKNPYEKSFRLFEQAEEYKHAPSRVMLAEMCLNGRGTIPDATRAFGLYQKLYKGGMTAAGFPLGYLCFHGKGTNKDYAKAVEYIQVGLKTKQRISGDFTPCTILGIIYFNGGYGVTKDMQQARFWLEKAQDENNAEAFYYLGCMYRDKLGGLPKNDEAAFECFNVANDRGYMPAKGALGRMYYFGKGTKQDYKTAIYMLRPVADRGDLEACLLIADALFEGKCKQKDDTAAFFYYRKLAERGDAHGLCRCGQMLLSGRGVAKSPENAYKFLIKSADKGNAEALYLCGTIEEQNQDLKRSVTHYRKAAGKGHNESMRKFAEMAVRGIGMKADPKLGLDYMRKLADNGDIRAQERYAMLMEKGINPTIKPNINDAVKYYEKAYKQKSELAAVRLAYIAYQQKQYELAFKYVLAPADRKNALAASLLGRLYFEGKGVPQDPNNAIHYLRIAADGGNAYATGLLGRMYYYRGNYQEAMYYLQKSSDRDTPEVRYIMGHIYYTGDKNIKQDYKRAMELLNSAADDGNIDAMLLLARMYQRGEGVEQNYETAFSLYHRAAERNTHEALFYVGLMYYNGNGVTPDFKTASLWFQKAAEKGNIAAMQYLIIMYRNGQGVEKDMKEVQKWQKKLNASK